MPPTVAIIAPGAMGAAIGGRLTEQGVRVLTQVEGRSAASAERARQFGMIPAERAEILDADLLLSIIPPGDALAMAIQWGHVIQSAPRKPLYVDCNAISPATAARIGEVLAEAGCGYVDASIIGGPPQPGNPGPRIYAAGTDAARFAELAQYGLEIRLLNGPAGAASALKMCYAGCTKGFIALGSAMMLAAQRNGAADALRRELEESQPQLLAWLTRMVPGMYSKAYRFVGEMEEISAFLGEDFPEHLFFDGAAGLYTRLAEDTAGPRRETGGLSAFLKAPE